MSNYSKLYWLTRLDGIHGLSILLCVLSCICIIAVIIQNGVSLSDDDCYTTRQVEERKLTRKKVRKSLIFSIPSFILSLIFMVFIPTTNEAILITAGGRTIDFIQKDSSINKIPSQTTEIISEFLNKQIKQLKEDKK